MKKEKQIENSLRLLVFVIGIFSICILLLSFKLKVNAESPSGEFPYIVPVNSDLNTFYTSSALDSATFYYENSIVNNVTINSYLVYTDYGFFNGSYYAFCFVPNPSITTLITPSYDYTSSAINVRANDSQIVRLLVNVSNNSIDGVNYLGYGVNLLGTASTSSNGNGVYTPNYPFYMSGSDVYYGVNNDGFSPVLVFTNSVPYEPDVFESGHAVEPTFDSDTIIDSGLHPNIKPTFPSINNYSFTTYVTPTLDTSSLENLVKSVYDAVVYNAQYLVSNYVGSINNFQQVVSDLLGYFGDLSSYLIQRVLNTIKQTSDNTYENFKGLLEPTLNSFANMINIYNTLYGLGLEDGTFNFGTLFTNLFVPEVSDLNSFIGSSREFTFVSNVQTSSLYIIDFVQDVVEADSIYEIHIPAFVFHGINLGPYTISFDWYIPIKPTIDTIISGFLILGYLWWLFTRISGILHGNAPDSSVANDLMNQTGIRG